jgi:PGF-pre-PGF domain-containing protein
MFMAQNFSQEFNQSDYNSSYMVFNQGLGNGTVIYSPDDSGETVYYPDQCANNSVPEEAPDKGCYTNSSSQVTLFVPHFSGGAITSEPACIDQDGDGYGQNCEAGTDFDDSDASEYPGASCTRDGYSGATYNSNGECTGGTEETSGDGGSSGGGSSGGSGGGLGSITSDRPSSSHSWFSTNKKKFSVIPKPATSVQTITVETAENQTSFEITVEKYSEKPDDVEEAEDTYNYLEIDVSASDEEIQNTSIEFSVNRSFAENHDVILSRHHNQVWNDLPTRPVEQEGKEWTYKASSSGFSYYAVRGTEKSQDQKEQQTQENQSMNENSSNKTGKLTSNISDSENQSSVSENNLNPESRKLPTYVAILGSLLAILLVGGYQFVGQNDVSIRDIFREG